MGYFKEINLNNYRNFENFFLEFKNGCNIILGKNGSGKTNVLESLSLLEKGRGFRKEKIENLINFNNQNTDFKIFSLFNNKNINYNIAAFSLNKNKKKIAVNDNFDLTSIKHFESLFSIIYFLPEMERLFISSPSFRRNFLDRLIFNFNKEYNIIVNKYKKAITERQLLLKDSHYDENWIQNIENNIAEYGSTIYKNREEHINVLNKILKTINSSKHFSKDFVLKIQDNFYEANKTIRENKNIYISQLQLNRKKDFFQGGCSIGPHRSDIIGYNELNNFNLNQLSTGQQKTVVLLIILAQSEYLINELNLHPIILLDEICSHLDDSNRELLLYLTNQLKVQVFMTGTEKDFFSFLSTKAHYCNIT
ncbi:DNA replication and repair protein RecF [Alphaproteobacteria bacterium]|nr:DNA replication and repair protein RecF [Alphaproteobacteria bacterium]